MRKINVTCLFLALLSTFCCGQKNSSNHFQPDLLRITNSKYLSVIPIKGEDGFHVMYIPYYEFYQKEIKVGEGCLFGISKEYPETWVIDASKSECSINRNAYQTIVCYARKMFKPDTIYVKKEFDLYFFFIDKKDLDGPYFEEVEGGTVENYYPKKGSAYFIFKYENDKWIEIERIRQEGEEIPRNFGMSYIKKIALQRMKKLKK